MTSCDVTLVKVYITWSRTAHKNVIYTIHIQPSWTDPKLTIWVLEISSGRQWSYEQFHEKNGTIVNKQFKFWLKNKNKASWRKQHLPIWRWEPFYSHWEYWHNKSIDKTIHYARYRHHCKQADMILDFKNDNAIVFWWIS